MLSVTTPKQIREHPVNTSSSKHHWTFGRDTRFKRPRSKYRCCKISCSQSAYNNRSCLSERKTSFGYGDRSKNFDGVKNIPEPGKYEASSEFDLKKMKKGFSFTANR